MAKKKTNLKSKNKKLSNTPFKTLKELNQAEREIDFEIWKRFAAHKSFKKHILADENEKIRKEFEEGMVCKVATKKNAKADEYNTIRIHYEPKSETILAKFDLTEPMSLQYISKVTTSAMYAFGSLFYEISGLKMPPLEQLDSSDGLSWGKN